MNAAHAAVADHEQIAAVAFRHPHKPAIGASPRHVAHLDNSARRCLAYRALEFWARQALDDRPAACPRSEDRDHMDEPYLRLRSGRDRDGERRQVSRIL
jgi:hypothetical protein